MLGWQVYWYNLTEFDLSQLSVIFRFRGGYDMTHHFAPVTKLYNVERRDVIHYSLNPSFRSTPSQQHAGHATFFPSCNAQRNRLPGIRQACTYVHKLGGEMVD